MPHSVVARTLGFAVPTVAAVTAGHLLAQASVGEAVDGVVSGLWFTALFAAGAAGRAVWLARGRGARVSTGRRRAALEGFLAGAAVWAALWGFWTVVPHEGPGFPSTLVFVAHSALMATVGAASPRIPAGGARRAASC